MSLNLVAYDYSDDEEDSNGDQESRSEPMITIEEKSTNDDGNKSKLNEESNLKNCDNNKNSSDSEDLKGLNQLPRPNQSLVSNAALGDIVVVDKRAKRIKITIPSLEEIDYDSDEEEAGPKRKITPAGGSGLTSLLPKPKNVPRVVQSTTTVVQLVPHSVSRPKANIPPPKKPVQTIPANFMKTKEDASTTADFFSLGDESVSVRRPSEAQLSHQDIKSRVEPKPEVELSYNEILMKKLADEGAFDDDNDDDDHSTSPSSSAVPSEPYSPHIAPPPPTMDLNDPDYKRFIAQKFGEELPDQIKIVDVDVSQYLRSSNELVKAISMEKPPEVTGPAPNSTAKRKHQITFLAYQAKQRELDLKNQAAANRFTRAQTRAKYGF